MSGAQQRRQSSTSRYNVRRTKNSQRQARPQATFLYILIPLSFPTRQSQSISLGQPVIRLNLDQASDKYTDTHHPRRLACFLPTQFEPTSTSLWTSLYHLTTRLHRMLQSRRHRTATLSRRWPVGYPSVIEIIVVAWLLEYLATIPHIGQDLLKLSGHLMHYLNPIWIPPRFPDLVHHHAVHLLQLLHTEAAGSNDYLVEEFVDEVKIDECLRGRAIGVK